MADRGWKQRFDDPIPCGVVGGEFAEPGLSEAGRCSPDDEDVTGGTEHHDGNSRRNPARLLLVSHDAFPFWV
jgi:hypothetical protein